MADDKRKSSSFSWETERDDALRDYSKNGVNGANFSFEERSRANNTEYAPKKNKPLWSNPISGGHYYYEMPSDDGYDSSPVYNPKAQYGGYNSQPKREERMNQYSQSGAYPYGERPSEHRQSTAKQSAGSNSSRPVSGKNTASASANTRTKNQSRQTQSLSPNQRRAAQNRPSADRMPNGRRVSPQQKTEDLKQMQRVKKRNAEYETKRDSGAEPDKIRRDKVKSNERSFKLNALAWVGLVIVLLAVVAVIFCEVRGFPIAEFKIEGASNYTQEQILDAGEVALGDNMLKVKQKKTNAKITKTLPYIRSVTVDWVLPSTLRLEIVETTDKFLIENGDKIVCVDELGKILAATKKKAGAGQYLVKGFSPFEYELGETFSPAGDNGDRRRYDLIKKISSAAEEAGLENCTEIDIADLDCFSIKCSKNCRIYLDKNCDFLSLFLTVEDDLKKNDPKTNDPVYYDCRFGKNPIRIKGELAK